MEEVASLTAVCDADPSRADKVAQKFPEVAKFTCHEALFDSGTCDAILIANAAVIVRLDDGK